MIVQFIFSAFSALGFAYIFNVRGKIAWAAAFVGGIGWIVYLVSMEAGLSLGPAFFLAGATATLGSEIIARVLKTPVTSALIPTFTPFVPGSGAYYTMFYLFNGQYDLAMEKAIATFIMSGSMILGFLFVSEFIKLYMKIKKSKKNIK